MAKKPRTVLEKVIAAVEALKDPKGASRQAIVKYLATEFDVTNAGAIKKALKSGVSSGKLEAQGARFQLHGVCFEAPADEKVEIAVLKASEAGEPAAEGDEVTVSYKGTLLDGTVFDSASKFEFVLGAGEVIKGWDQGVKGMRVGEKRRLTCPPKLGYGKRGAPPDIPGDATLVFGITLKAIK